MFESISGNISFILVFFEGIFSFFSPCILPLIPIYITYLAGNGKITLEDGSIVYNRKKVFLHTLFFTIGICCTFFILGISFTALGRLLNSYQLILTRVGGILIILLGLFQLGLFNINFLQKERKFNFDMSKKEVNPFVAFVMGFTFSFAWTPCVGPALSSVLLLASNSKNALTGNLLVGIYSLGFIIPFLLLGLFTGKVLNFFREKQSFVKYTVKISGILLILIGIMTFTGYMNNISNYLNRYISSNVGKTENSEDKEELEETQKIETETEDITTSEQHRIEDKPIIPAFDFTLEDIEGNKHTLSEYKGKVVFLNFWATWCKPCEIEMPYMEEIYKEYGYNKEDVVVLAVANPVSNEYPHNVDISKDEIKQFVKDREYSFPILFDETGEVLREYAIRAFPTTFMVDKDGNIYGYVPGSLTKNIMKSIIEETLGSFPKDNK